MSELSFATIVAVHGEDQFAGWANHAPGALDEGTTKGPDLPEAPQRGALCGRATGARVELDLQLASEVVSKDAGEHVQLVADSGLDRYVIHLGMMKRAKRRGLEAEYLVADAWFGTKTMIRAAYELGCVRCCG